jgi:hypothetical protein
VRRKKCTKGITTSFDRDDARWREQAKEMWLKNGERNTQYYHACANAKRWKNSIYAIMDVEG